MMVSLKDLMTDSAFNDGGWIDDPPGLEGVGLKVRNIGCSQYKELQQREAAKLPKSARRPGASHAPFEAILEKGLREVILLDWRGIEDEGKPLEYSAERAAQLVKSPVFRDAVVWAASIVGQKEGRDHQAEIKADKAAGAEPAAA